MADILQTTFPNAFSWKQTLYIDLHFTKFFDNNFSLVLVLPCGLFDIAWTNDDRVHWRIYASPGLNESME